jgi:DNA invertase Pin-like site-specific DNA recombinase
MKSIPKRALLYLRVSTEEQLNNFSLKTQEDICRKEAERRGYIIEKIFKEEGKSAKTIVGRPTLAKLLQYCRKNQKRIGALIVYRLDRLSRQTGDYLTIRNKLNNYGIALISTAEPTGTSPTEKLIETILAGFAQLENDIRGERSRNGMRTRFMSGLPNGVPPPGYLMLNGYVVKDINCFDKVKKAWDIMATGTKCFKEMAEILNGFKLRNGKTGKRYKFTPKNIYRIFKNKHYMGVIVSATYQLEVQAQHVPMITKEQFLKVQEIMNGKNKNKIDLVRKNQNNEDFPLRRFIKCVKCKRPFTGSWSSGRCKKYAYYHCNNQCKNASVPRNLIHSYFSNLLKTRPATTEYITFYLSLLENVFQKRFSKIKQKQIRTASQISKLRNFRQSLIDKNLAGIYSDKDFKEQFDLIEDQLHNMALFSNQTSLEQYTKEATREYIKKKIIDLPNAYETFDIKQKRTVISLLFPKGLVWEYPGLTVVP